MMNKDGKNCWITAGLFEETASQYREAIRWTLDEAKNLFVECGDVTGYEFAVKHLGGWQHWLAIKNSKALERYVREWEEELEAKIRSQALGRIATEAEGGHFQANKFLNDRGWETRKAGRPSKEEVERETRVQSKIKDEYANDILRIKR